ncbi:hypothetical protein [Vibrio parahaemolyticus]|uniref:hypothetical protein n=1 Tax=Vibrio parahaemolyticus TaxID=670 RepID=UPI001120584A|nr:hypothetical protein [Vibrio parahaemolyticus]
MFDIKSNISVNAVFFLSSDVEEDGGQSMKLAEDIHLLANVSDCDFFPRDVANRKELVDQLLEIDRQCSYNDVYPIIHFNFHGHETKGLYLSSGTYMSWDELSKYLKAINKTLKNNLAVFFTTCHSARAFNDKNIEIDDITPYSYMVAPERRLLFSEIEEKMPSFYRELFMGGGLQRAYNTLGNNYFLYHSELMFAEIMINYLKSQCLGVGRERNINRFVDVAISKGVARTDENLLELRKAAEKAFTPDQEYFNKYLAIFLAGKHVSFSITDLWDRAKKEA